MSEDGAAIDVEDETDSVSSQSQSGVESEGELDETAFEEDLEGTFKKLSKDFF